MLERLRDALAGILEHPVDHEAAALDARRVEPHRDEIEQRRGVHRSEQLGAEHRPRRELRHAAPQLARAGQVGVAPGRGLRLVAELLEGVGAQCARRLVVGLGEHHLIRHLRHPAVLAAREVLARMRQRRLGAAHVGERLFRRLDWRQRIEVGGIAVVPAEIALVHRLRVVAHRAVIAAHRPFARQLGRQIEHLGDLRRFPAVVHQAHRLVVHVLVEVALLREEIADARAAPGRPVVLADQHLGLIAEQLQRLREVMRPQPRVAHHRAAQRAEVVQVAGGVLRHVEHAAGGHEHVHLGRCLGARCELEHDLDAVDAVRLQRRRDVARRRDQADRAARHRLAEPGVDLAARPGTQQAAELELRAARHRIAGEHVLAGYRFEKSRRRDDLHAPGAHVGVRDHALHAAVVVDVAVAVDQRDAPGAAAGARSTARARRAPSRPRSADR